MVLMAAARVPPSGNQLVVRPKGVDGTSSCALEEDPIPSAAGTKEEGVGPTKDEKRTVTLEELEKHCSAASPWVAIAGKVYDVTQWQGRHPGGQLPLLAVAGGDATDIFQAMHPPHAWLLLSKFLVGELVEGPSATSPTSITSTASFASCTSSSSSSSNSDGEIAGQELSSPGDDVPSAAVPASDPAPSKEEKEEEVEEEEKLLWPILTDPSTKLSPEETAMVLDFRALARQVRAAGLARHDPSFYVRRAMSLSAVAALVVAGVCCSSSCVVHLLSAVLLGLWWNQVNFVGHDAGHNGITGKRSVDEAIGFLVGNTLTGISIGWWKRTHNVHHIVPNSVNYDPDVQHIPIFAVSRLLFLGHYSLYHFRRMTFDPLARFLVSFQHLSFYPVMCFARINLYVQSLLLLCSSTPLNNRHVEAATLLAFWGWYSALLLQLPSWRERVAFFLISHAFTAILHIQICVSHFSSPVYEGRNTAAVWARTQIQHTKDISCPPWLDWFHGGLQFQIEHHLFPRVPRANLRAIAPSVQAFCKRHGLPYSQPDFWEANVLVVETLRSQAMLARTHGKKEGDSASMFFNSLLWDGLNARG